MKSFLGRFVLYALLLFSIPAFAASENAAERNRTGVMLMQEGNIDEAVVEFEKALSLDRKYFPARLNLAYAYEKANRSEEAMKAYREAIDAQPQNFFAHNNLGVLYDRAGLYDSAIGEFERALQIEPGNSAARLNLQTARQNKITNEKRESELSRAEKEAQDKPSDPRAAYNLARIYAYYGNKDAALQWLGRAIKQGYGDLGYLRADPAFRELRKDRDFELLLLQK